MVAKYVAGLLNEDKSINSRAAFCVLLKNALPPTDQSFDALIEVWRTELMKVGASRDAVRNVTGDFYEWLIAICAWNFRVKNTTKYIALKLPNVQQFEVSTLYQPMLYQYVADLRKKIQEAANVSLITSNPDF